MKYLPIFLIIAIALAVCHFDAPERHIDNAVNAAESACWTSFDTYSRVDLIAAQRRK